MVEIIKHSFGFCGDGHSHPNIFLLFGLITTYGFIIKHKVKWSLNKITNSLKKLF